MNNQQEILRGGGNWPITGNLAIEPQRSEYDPQDDARDRLKLASINGAEALESFIEGIEALVPVLCDGKALKETIADVFEGLMLERDVNDAIGKIIYELRK